MRIADERAAKRNYTRRTRTIPRQKRIEFRYRAEEATSARERGSKIARESRREAGCTLLTVHARPCTRNSVLPLSIAESDTAEAV